MLAALAVCLSILLYQIWLYWFLTDDAFISFRYARNLRDGHGLVFNPGFERVEGYTNFLWVLILAGCNLVTGWAPHLTANWLSAAAGVALWGVTVAFCGQRAPRASAAWVVFPALWLALNRSFAVWCTSGLETKLFELFVVGGVLLGVREVERREPSSWRPALLFALAALTRPDGILLAGSFFAARLALEAWQRRLDALAFAKSIALFGAVVGAHFAFRFAYYGELLPNTYYAKLDGHSWWDMGFLYLRTFLWEYGALVWVPLLVLGAIGSVRARRPAAPWLIGAVVLPHALYVAYCGGDHFEYRPLDVYFPLLAVLLFDGALLAERSLGRVVARAWSAACCAAVVLLPILTHVDFPSDYVPGFPGGEPRADGNRDLIDLRQHAWLSQVPGLAAYVRGYNTAFAELSLRFVGLRQEEHRMFLASVEHEGAVLAAMVADGLLPPDTHIAIPCVGAIPYFGNLRTLDELGLTDKVVARQTMPSGDKRMMAHDKKPPLDYLISSKVDLVAPLTPHLITRDPRVVELAREFGRRIGPQGQLYISKPVLDGYTVIAVVLRPEAFERLAALELRPAWESGFDGRRPRTPAAAPRKRRAAARAARRSRAKSTSQGISTTRPNAARLSM